MQACGFFWGTVYSKQQTFFKEKKSPGHFPSYILNRHVNATKVVSAFWSLCRRCHFVVKFLLFFIVLGVLALSNYFDFRLQLNIEL